MSQQSGRFGVRDSDIGTPAGQILIFGIFPDRSVLIRLFTSYGAAVIEGAGMAGGFFDFRKYVFPQI